MKRNLILLGACMFLLLAGCGASEEEVSYRQITMSDAIRMMAEEKGYIILDVRTKSEFTSGHIPMP